MIASTFIVALMAVAAEASRPAPASGWQRVGCVRLEDSRQDTFPSGYKLSDQNKCLEECGSSDASSSMAMIGDKCWCSGANLDSLAVMDGGDFNCEAACYPDDPDSKSCGALSAGVQYYDLYKQDSCEVKIVVKPGYPVPPANAGGSSSTSEIIATPTDTCTDLTTTCTKTVTKSAGSASTTAAATGTGSGSGSASSTGSGASATSTLPVTGSSSRPYVSGVFSASIVFMVASFLV